MIDVVRGADTEKVRERGHDQLPTWGVGAGRPKAFWQGLVRQCLAGGWLELDIGGYGALRITPAGEAVLKGRARLEIREITMPKREARRQKIAALADDGDVDPERLAALKALRKDLAAERKVPAYVVFPDATLIDMCRIRPRTLEELGLVKGVGPKKLAEFGDAFLAVLKARD